MNLIKKTIFSIKRPKVVVVTGKARLTAKEAVSRVLSRYFAVGREVLIFQTDLATESELKKFSFLIRKSSFPILVVTNVGDIPPDNDFFAGEKKETERILPLAKELSPGGCLVLNFDDETSRELKSKSRAPSITFGLQERADLAATDIVFTQLPSLGTNFKVNYQGNIVPVWLKNLFGKEQIYASLAAAATSTSLDLNLVEVSESLKRYEGLPGRMRLIDGIKGSMILDDSESATPFSMAEAIEVLKNLPGFKRKVAVLGDIVGVGKYTIESHEAIGERVAAAADILFAFGARARFIAAAAAKKGMGAEKIFQFDAVSRGKLKLQNEIRKGDLILVDGSREMRMSEAVEEIKA